ncbi:MAG: hypothetical protein ACOCVU_06950 [Desulfohalobiaceae bacterium]
MKLEAGSWKQEGEKEGKLEGEAGRWKVEARDKKRRFFDVLYGNDEY